MDELQKKKAELEAKMKEDLDRREKGFLEGYEALKKEWNMQLVPHRLESPKGVEWRQIATPTE